MSENAQAASASNAGESAQLKSEKQKDIRQTNIIAAKGKSTSKIYSSRLMTFNLLLSCRWCRQNFPWPQRYG